ncbi:hypothetical protein DPEC_G00059460 [Dallia pectoralis]|uniref:Uncharacterized protein n=1 Tax=Dallia pectoralis TaxID=75939 RepID=A0ACC2H7B1_DALPE|nr:hypothetical protein DPEC_G00059460 [Dallia pectoralis]
MKVFLLLVVEIGHLYAVGITAVTHSLKHLVTDISGETNFPEFTAVSLLDNCQVGYFDSITMTAVPKTEWIEGNGSDFWDFHTELGIVYYQLFKRRIKGWKNLFNQSMSTGVHALQVIMGCGWDVESGVTNGFLQYGYDGEDFISFDLKTLTWIASVPQAVIKKHMWDNNKADNEYWKNYITQECIDWLKMFLEYGRSSLMRTVPPSVSLLQKTPSSPVTCHATGFYPSRVTVTWKKDGQEQHKDVEYGETLQNDDRTFQKSVHLTVKPEEWKNNKYQCVVQVSGINEDIIKVLTEDEIQTNRGVNDQTPTGIIIGVVVGVVLLLTAAVIGVVIWRKTRRAFIPANPSESFSNSSNNLISS